MGKTKKKELTIRMRIFTLIIIFFLQGFSVVVQVEVLISFVSNKHFYCLKYHFKTLTYDNTSTVAFQEKKNPPNIKCIPDFFIPFINSHTFKNYS